MRYFFHVYDDIACLDEEGSELPSAEAAHQSAVEFVRELAAWEVQAGRIILDHRIEIADETGAVIDVVRFRDAVEVVG
jgi:hypothetical protein